MNDFVKLRFLTCSTMEMRRYSTQTSNFHLHIMLTKNKNKNDDMSWLKYVAQYKVFKQKKEAVWVICRQIVSVIIE